MGDFGVGFAVVVDVVWCVDWYVEFVFWVECDEFLVVVCFGGK